MRVQIREAHRTAHASTRTQKTAEHDAAVAPDHNAKAAATRGGGDALTERLRVRANLLLVPRPIGRAHVIAIRRRYDVAEVGGRKSANQIALAKHAGRSVEISRFAVVVRPDADTGGRANNRDGAIHTIASESRPRARAEDPVRRGSWQLNDAGSHDAYRVADREWGRQLDRFEDHQRGLVVECGLQQIDLRLEKVSLSLCDEEGSREAHLIPTLFRLETFLGQRGSRTRGTNPFGGALNLPAGTPDRFGRLNTKARDSLGRLTALDLGLDQAGRFVAVPEWIADSQAKTPRRKIIGKDLAQRIAETKGASAGHE